MKPLFNHKLITSFALYLDNQLCNGAQAYQNVTTGLYPQRNLSVSGYVYASPYKSWIADSCVSGANVPSGVWTTSGQFLTRQSGAVIDFVNGRVITPQNWGRLTGSFAYREFNIYTSTEKRVNWWLDNVFGADKDISYTATGIPGAISFVAPCIILTNAREQNDPFALGGLDQTRNTIRGYIISNSAYLQEGVNSYCRDMARQWVPLVGYGDAPFTNSGDLKTGYYCYNDLCAQYGPAGIYIEAVHDVKLNQNSNNATSFSISVAEFDLNTVRQPRVNK